VSDGTSSPRLRPPGQIAVGMVQDAEAYRLAAVRVHPRSSPHQDGMLLAPAWHLLCHSVELTLKAYLLSAGADPSGGKGGLKHSSIRHNLVGLHERAQSHGFKPAGDGFEQVVAFLGPYHGDHVFRYRKPGSMPLFPPHAIADILKPVIAGASRTVRERWQATLGVGQADKDLAKVGLGRAYPSNRPA
jgi:hypothetical protein